MPAERKLVDIERLERSLRAAYRQAWPQREIVALLKELLRQEVNSERHPLLRVQLAEALLSLEHPSRLQAWQAAALARSVSRAPVIVAPPAQLEPSQSNPSSLGRSKLGRSKPRSNNSGRNNPDRVNPSRMHPNQGTNTATQSDASQLLARAEAAQGLAHTLLGHYSLAKHCYERAYQLDPEDPVVNHNLGHLLACVFSESQRALPHLEAAWRGLPNEVEVAASFAHALSRVEQLERARRVLTSAGLTSEQADHWFHTWAAKKPD